MGQSASEGGAAPREVGCVTIEPVTSGSGGVDWTATKAKLQDAYQGLPSDAETGAPAWQAAYNQLYAQEQEKQIVQRMQEIDKQIPGTRVEDWPYMATHHGGYVIDEQDALNTPCTRIDLGNGDYLVYSAGIVGALSPDLEQKYCAKGFVDEQPSPAQAAHIQQFARASHSCSLSAKSAPSTELHLEQYYSCMGQALKGNGNG